MPLVMATRLRRRVEGVIPPEPPAEGKAQVSRIAVWSVLKPPPQVRMPYANGHVFMREKPAIQITYVNSHVFMRDIYEGG